MAEGIESRPIDFSAITQSLNLGPVSGASANEATINAFDSITILDHIVCGVYGYYGVWAFIAYKYANTDHGMMLAIKYDGTTRLLSRIEGTNNLWSLNTTAV